MARLIERHNTKQILGISGENLAALQNWLDTEISDALAFRTPFENVWRDCLRMYEGVPRIEVRDIPVENAPNIEVTVGAIASDTIYAQAVDLVFNTTPVVTVRAVPKKKDDKIASNRAKALQRFVNHTVADQNTGFRAAAEASILDDVQLGTGLVYVPWVERVVKTKSSKVLSVGPRFYSLPIEDAIVPAGSYSNIEELPFVSLRFYRTVWEVNELAKANNWNLEGIQPISSKNPTRTTREMLLKNSDPSNRYGILYDIHLVYCHFDIDGDGIAEDLLVVWNHSGRRILRVNFSPNDRRPLEKMVYQLRAHLFYGLGVLQMMRPYEDKLSDIHNYATLNVLLANSRMWVGSEGLPETMKIWPGKYVQTPNPREDLIPLQMADVYNSIWQDQMVTMQLANQRVGINDVSSPKNIPSRTPGVTAMSFLQQVNRRFVPAFESIRYCLRGAVMQSLFRWQERLLAGDARAEETILAILGYEDGMHVISILKDEEFDQQVTVELTAASTSINREADRQNAIMLTNILAQYYPEVRSVAQKVIDGASEIIDRTIRTFDQVRDPGAFIIEVEDELNQMNAGAQEQQALAALMGLLGGGGTAPPLELPTQTMA
jgi:hypothetical protein